MSEDSPTSPTSRSNFSDSIGDETTQTLTASLEVGEDSHAMCTAHMVHRKKVDLPSFGHLSYVAPEEVGRCVLDLFDRNGRLQWDFYNHEVQRGTSVWGTELNDGDLVVFDYIRVTESLRRQGVGTHLVRSILDQARSRSNHFFAFVSPGYLVSEIDAPPGPEAERMQAEHMIRSVRFWQMQGFRRIGYSRWLAFTDQPSHPSKFLAMAEDTVHPVAGISENPMTAPVRNLFSVAGDPDTSDEECLQEIKNALPSTSEDGSWDIVDDFGQTILHLSALNCRPHCIDYILSTCPRLKNARDKLGYTPLEQLRTRLDGMREKHEKQVDIRNGLGFFGYSRTQIKCLAKLEGSEIVDLDGLS